MGVGFKGDFWGDLEGLREGFWGEKEALKNGKRDEMNNSAGVQGENKAFRNTIYHHQWDLLTQEQQREIIKGKRA